MEFSRQEYWSGLPFPFPGDFPKPGIKPRSPVLQADFLLPVPPRKALKKTLHKDNSYTFSSSEVKSLSHARLCNPMDCSPSGSSVHGILQARILEWIAVSFSRGFSQPKDRTQVSALQADALTSEPPRKPVYFFFLIFPCFTTKMSLVYRNCVSCL